jgi:hypothetical protein
MLDRARAAPGGDAANIEWTLSSAEEFDFSDRYALLVAAESIHWMDLDVVFDGARRCLGAQGVFAVVSREYEAAWDDALRQLIPRYSATRDFRPFDQASLEGSGRLNVEGRLRTSYLTRRQTVVDYIEFQHSSAGCARHRMGVAQVTRFDEELRRVLRPHARDGWLEYGTAASVSWGRVG